MSPILQILIKRLPSMIHGAVARKRLEAANTRLTAALAQRALDLEAQRARAELLAEQVRAERQQFETIISAMTDAVVVRDAQGIITHYNPVAQRLLGPYVMESEPIERFRERLQATFPDGRPIAIEDLPQVRARNGEVVTEWECMVVLPRGERQLNLSAAPIRDDHGLIRGTVTVLRDVTEARLAERAKDRFLSIASHELKTPLSPLRVYIQYLQRRIERNALEPAELNHALERMDAQVARLALLIDDLLDISRLRESRLGLRLESVDLVALANQVVARFRAEGELTDDRSHDIQLEARVAELRGRWDPGRLDQVLTNLVSNAMKYSPADTTVSVCVERVDGQARLSVRDQGIGVPTDELDQLFQPFHRGRNAPVLYFGGLGLGLAISRGIVERHGGRIWAESHEGQGSTFRVELPLDGPPEV